MGTTIEEVCRDIVSNVDGGVSCGVVDLEDGRLLGVYSDGVSFDDMSRALSSAAMDLSRGLGEKTDAASIRDVHVASDHSDQFVKAIDEGRAVVILVTRKIANIGMGWAQVNAAVPRLEERLVRSR